MNTGRVVRLMAILCLVGIPLDIPRADQILPAADEYTPDPTIRGRPAHRRYTLWKVRVEGERGDWLVPAELMQEYGLHAGQTVSIETARRMAIDLGADYPRDILNRLEKLK